MPFLPDLFLLLRFSFLPVVYVERVSSLMIYLTQLVTTSFELVITFFQLARPSALNSRLGLLAAVIPFLCSLGSRWVY
jgi:hypothetical protein